MNWLIAAAIYVNLKQNRSQDAYLYWCVAMFVLTKFIYLFQLLRIETKNEMDQSTFYNVQSEATPIVRSFCC